MARDEKPAGRGRVKVRFVEFELEGSDQTLQSSIREITHAMGRSPVIVKQVPVALPGAASKINGAAESTADVEDAELTTPEESTETPSDEDPGEERTRKPRRFKSPKIVQIELRDGDVPLKKFLEQVSPDSDAKRYTSIAYWFKTYRNIDEMTADHIYTAFREMGWTTLPKDVAQPFRNLKRDGWFDKGQSEGGYTLNHIGEGKALDMVNAVKTSG